jgi:alpha-amylase
MDEQSPLLEQLELYAPEVLASFRQLAAIGCVEFLAETYYHSLSFLYSREEFIEQIRMDKQTIHRLFGQTPRVFRNTELIYNNDLAAVIEQLGGFDAILAEGADHILGYRSPNFVYRPPHSTKLKLLLKNYRLSDDIAFRFSDRNWSEYLDTEQPLARLGAWGCGFSARGKRREGADRVQTVR